MSIIAGQNVVPTDFVIQVTAGEALSENDAVYIKTSDGKAYKTDADDLTMIGFVGFVEANASISTTVSIRTNGIKGNFSGLTIGSVYYLSGTAGAVTATAPTNFKQVGIAITTTLMKIFTEPTKRVRVYSTATAVSGSSTTRFDITNPAGTTFRYTFDGTGTDPSFSAVNNPIGSYVEFAAQNFNAGNNGLFIVTGSGANYVEVTNASGVAENDKTIGTGYVRIPTIWTKPAGLRSLEVELVGGGADGDSSGNGGASGGYSREKFEPSSLSATEPVLIGDRAATNAFSSSFGLSAGAAYLKGTGAAGQTAGTGTGGDVNIDGEAGGTAITTTAPSTSTERHFGGDGGGTPLGDGGKGTRNSGTPGNYNTGSNGSGYGSGGGGASASGKQGVVIVTEIY